MQPDDAWCAAQLKPNGLSIAERHIARQGFTTFCPKRREDQRRGTKFVKQTVPLFPGYIFVQFDPEAADWRRVNSTRGVTRLITDTRGRPAVMPKAFMSALLTRCTDAHLFTPADSFAAGDEIRIVSGPFADTITRIESADAQGRLEILLDIMGQAVRTHLPSTAVEKLNARAD
jgi:transcriptional antiterminator RfaH